MEGWRWGQQGEEEEGTQERLGSLGKWLFLRTSCEVTQGPLTEGRAAGVLGIGLVVAPY